MSDSLKGGDRLNAGDFLTSADGAYTLLMQQDGNLVLYQTGNAPVWATNTWNLPPALRPTYAEMQADGNFVLYTPARVAIWASGTDGHPGASLTLQDDRNVVIYDAGVQPGAAGQALWSSNTWIAPHQEVKGHADGDVGFKKHMTTDATLYANGQLEVTVFTKNDNWTGGLRGRVFVVCVDPAGRATWISQVFECTVRCSLFDPSCASYGQQVFSQQFPQAVSDVTRRLDIYQADDPHFVDLQQKLKDAIKTAKDLAPEIMAVINLL